MRASRSLQTAVLMVAALIVALPAAATFERVSLAYEVATRNFTPPATQSGGLVLRQCDTCTRQSIRVTPGTLYVLDGESLSLDKFKEALQLSGSNPITLTVLHHLESDTVLRVSATTIRNTSR